MEVLAALAQEPTRDGNLAVQCALLHDVIEGLKMMSLYDTILA